MTSSRGVQATAPKAARTYGKASRPGTTKDQDSETDGKSLTSQGQELTRNKARLHHAKQPPKMASSARSRNTADPYSFSGSDGDDAKADQRRAQDARKRKHAQAFVNKVSAPSPEFVDHPKAAASPRRLNGGSTGAPSARPSRTPLFDSDAEAFSSKSSDPTMKPAESQSTPPRKQPRLIDALTAQKEDSSSSESETDQRAEKGHERGKIRSIDAEFRSLMGPGSIPSLEARSPAKTYTPRTTESTKIKFTYSQVSRSMAPPSRDNNRFGVPVPEEPESDSILSSPLGPRPEAFDFSEVSDVEDDKRMIIKSVHELRRAGANNRFSDELEDLLSRIGKPSSKPSTLRRNALLELSQKLQQKDFDTQFRDHTDRDSIALRLGEEQDVISGFALSAILVQFLSHRPAPHLLHKLATEGIGSLLGRLLLAPDDIDTIASRKETNLSKHSRHTLREVKSYLLRMNIWSDHVVSTLSPRILALQLLDILYQSSNAEESRMINADCLDNFANATSEVTEEVEGSSRAGVDFSLLVSIMESQSNAARDAGQEIMWLRLQSTNASRILHRSLRAWNQLHARTRLAALKMAINVTNTGAGASAFADARLLADVSRSIVDGIITTSAAVEQSCLDDSTYECLLLVLGVLINILEHCPSARSAMDSTWIHSLATLHADNRLAMSEADSEEKSKLSVAFGYLAVSLGYLALSEPGLAVVRSLQSDYGMRKLLGSIRDFIDVYKNVDSKIHGLEGLVSELQTQLV